MWRTVKVPALVIFFLTAQLAIAQVNPATNAPKLETRTLADNDRVQVIEERLVPGAVSESESRPYSVVRVIHGGTLQRIYPDGKSDTSQWKTDEVKVAGASAPYVLKNVGDTEVLLYAVRLK